MGIANLLKILNSKNEALEEELKQAYDRINMLEGECAELERQLAVENCALNQALINSRELIYD